MIRHLLASVALFLTAFAALAAPTVTSITPNSGPLAGGTLITIHGSGFTMCTTCNPPVAPIVYFGTTPGTNLQVVDANTITVVAPRHLPGSVDLFLTASGGSTAVSNGYTYVGNISDTFETILLPIFAPQTHGAFGSLWDTQVLVGTTGDQSAQLYANNVEPMCGILFDPPPIIPESITIAPNSTMQLFPNCSFWPARLYFVPKEQSSFVTFNERVRDLSRAAESHGTEIPVVRSSRMRSGRITLLGVPIDNKFRNTLRVYGYTAMTVRVSIGDQEHDVVLQAGPTIAHPSYAQFSDFPIPVEPGSPGTLRVTIDPPSGPVGPSPIVPGPPIWAFITVTNNETQQITTITPDF